MLDIFTNTYQARALVSNAPGIDNFRNKIKQNVARMQEYYASNVRSVPSAHPFVQALKHSGVYTYDAVDLQNNAIVRSPYISKNFQFTTEFNPGSFLKHKVYSFTDNMIYTSTNYVRPYQAVSNWSSLRPLKAMWLDQDHLDMSVPNANLQIQDGLAAVHLDIPLMALMYKGFKEDPKFKAMVLGEDQFVATFVLPSILESQADITMISALIAVYDGDYRYMSRVNSNYYLPSYSAEFEKIARFVLERISDTRMQYKDILQNIPCVYATSALEALTLPDFIPTTQVDWAMLATRMKVINFLLDVGGPGGRRANQGFITKLKVFARQVRAAKVPYLNMSDNMAAFYDISLSKYLKL